MLKLDDAQCQAFRDAVSIASSRSDVRDAVGNVYRALQDAIEIRSRFASRQGGAVDLKSSDISCS